MRLEELDFDCPEELIAQEPAQPRDACRLMHLPLGRGPRHLVFSDLPRLLQPGDCLVFNDSRVLPARLEARKLTGGKVELLFLRPRTGEDWASGERWEVLAKPSHRLRPGGLLVLPGGEELVLETLVGEGRWVLQGPPGRSMSTLMELYGRLPLPPYIKKHPADPSSYQTVYALEPGSAAAPTAGLHFTKRLLAGLHDMGVKAAYVTLHVGLDTFQPIREAVVEEHRIHRESFSVPAPSLATIRETRAEGGRIVAVGTTATRVLETLAGLGALAEDADAGPVRGSTDIFILPGYRFRAVDALLTNLHLPRSSVLALTMAFAGAARLRAAYQEAVARRYRFFSFGDAMLIDGPPPGAPEAGMQPGGTDA
jgi:S-adenosylmethionine:tRNA ribosyltransferase-isomerase